MAMTLNGTTGIVLPTAAAPAFSAYYNGSTASVSSNTWTKIQFNAEDFDTNSNFDSTTNYRFTPTVAGYYQLNACVSVSVSGSTTTPMSLAFYKNGSIYKGIYGYNYVGYPVTFTLSHIVYFNGSTDYVEVYQYLQGNTGGYTGSTLAPASGTGSAQTIFSGSMIRSA